MRPHRDLSSVDLAATFSQVADEFFARIELCARWLVAIEIADQTNAERNIVQIIAVHVAAVDLAPPTIAYFDLTVAGGSSVPDHEMVCESVLHPANMPVIIIKDARVSLPCAAVMDNNELPSAPFHRRASDGFDD
jgi:hypothetical protein